MTEFGLFKKENKFVHIFHDSIPNFTGLNPLFRRLTFNKSNEEWVQFHESQDRNSQKVSKCIINATSLDI